jgi:hypothetical protein
VINVPDNNQLPKSLAIQKRGKDTVAQIIRVTDTNTENFVLGLYNSKDQWLENYDILLPRGVTKKEIVLPSTMGYLPDIQTAKLEHGGVSGISNWPAESNIQEIGLVTNTNTQTQLKNPHTYILAALPDQYDITQDDWHGLLEQNFPIIVTTTDPAHHHNNQQLLQWLQKGGRLIYFASDDFIGNLSLMAAPLRLAKNYPDNIFNASPVTARITSDYPASSNIKLSSQYFQHWILAESTMRQHHVWARLSDETAFILSFPVVRGEIILVTASPSPEWGNWVIENDFQEIFQSLLKHPASRRDNKPGFNVDLTKLDLISAGSWPDYFELDDLTVRDNQINLSPYIFMLICLIFIIDQALILIRFSGLWRQR